MDLWRKLACGVALAAGLLSGAGPVLAHHSFAMFDMSKSVTLQGVVAEWQWTNPHSWLELTVTDNGKPANYSIESNSPNVLTRRGWVRDILKPGDKVTVLMNPLRNGEKGGNLRQLTLADGKVLLP